MFLARPPKSSMDFRILESKMCFSGIYKVNKISYRCFSHGYTVEEELELCHLQFIYSFFILFLLLIILFLFV